MSGPVARDAASLAKARLDAIAARFAETVASRRKDALAKALRSEMARVRALHPVVGKSFKSEMAGHAIECGAEALVSGSEAALLQAVEYLRHFLPEDGR